MIEKASGPLSVLGPVALLGFVLSLTLMALLRPWLAHFAMARPNARSSPPPRNRPRKGTASRSSPPTLLATWSAAALFPAVLQNVQSQVLAVTAALLAVIGAIDDVRPLPAAGFASFNKPVARLFLGDVGNLPIGLLLGWLLLQLAGEGYPAAALILPLYYLFDATITLLRRIARGERGA